MKVKNPKTEEIVTLTPESAKVFIKEGWAEVVEDEPEAKPTDDKRHPEISVPVKTGGRGWIDLTLWLGDLSAPQDFQKRSSVVMQKKQQNPDTRKVENVGEAYYLTPSQAIGLVGYLGELGLTGKLHDLKQKEASK